jgi:signal transduction histidine kinase
MEPFGQVENSLARSFEGTGLGLPLARRMTELHGGRLVLRSVKGVGTTVEVSLPASRILWANVTRSAQVRALP